MRVKKKVFLCFDLDNTLIAGNAAQVAAYQMAFQKHHLTPLPDRAILHRFGMAGYTLVKELYPFLTEKEVDAVVRDHDLFLIQKTHRFVQSIPGVARALRILHDKGYVMAVVSNSRHPTLITLLKAGGIDLKFFSVYVGNDDVKHAKPFPDEIFKAEHLMHMKAAYMIGDTIYDVLAARRAHVKALAVLTGHQPQHLLKRYHPYAILKSVADLPDFLAYDMKKTYLHLKKKR